MTAIVRMLGRGVMLAALALALTGCASDGDYREREPRYDDRDEQRLPGFTPFSA